MVVDWMEASGRSSEGEEEEEEELVAWHGGDSAEGGKC